MRKFDLSLRSSRSSYFATFRHQLTILSKTDALDEEKWLDRKSGSAGMPRPISYAVFCLKKKKRAKLLHSQHRHNTPVQYEHLPHIKTRTPIDLISYPVLRDDRVLIVMMVYVCLILFRVFF